MDVLAGADQIFFDPASGGSHGDSERVQASGLQSYRDLFFGDHEALGESFFSSLTRFDLTKSNAERRIGPHLEQLGPLFVEEVGAAEHVVPSGTHGPDANIAFEATNEVVQISQLLEQQLTSLQSKLSEGSDPHVPQREAAPSSIANAQLALPLTLPVLDLTAQRAALQKPASDSGAERPYHRIEVIKQLREQQEQSAQAAQQHGSEQADTSSLGDLEALMVQQQNALEKLVANRRMRASVPVQQAWQVDDGHHGSDHSTVRPLGHSADVEQRGVTVEPPMPHRQQNSKPQMKSQSGPEYDRSQLQHPSQRPPQQAQASQQRDHEHVRGPGSSQQHGQQQQQQQQAQQNVPSNPAVSSNFPPQSNSLNYSARDDIGAEVVSNLTRAVAAEPGVLTSTSSFLAQPPQERRDRRAAAKSVDLHNVKAVHFDQFSGADGHQTDNFFVSEPDATQQQSDAGRTSLSAQLQQLSSNASIQPAPSWTTDGSQTVAGPQHSIHRNVNSVSRPEQSRHVSHHARHDVSAPRPQQTRQPQNHNQHNIQTQSQTQRASELQTHPSAPENDDLRNANDNIHHDLSQSQAYPTLSRSQPQQQQSQQRLSGSQRQRHQPQQAALHNVPTLQNRGAHYNEQQQFQNQNQNRGQTTGLQPPRHRAASQITPKQPSSGLHHRALPQRRVDGSDNQSTVVTQQGSLEPHTSHAIKPRITRHRVPAPTQKHTTSKQEYESSSNWEADVAKAMAEERAKFEQQLTSGHKQNAQRRPGVSPSRSAAQSHQIQNAFGGASHENSRATRDHVAAVPNSGSGLPPAGTAHRPGQRQPVATTAAATHPNKLDHMQALLYTYQPATPLVPASSSQQPQATTASTAAAHAHGGASHGGSSMQNLLRRKPSSGDSKHTVDVNHSHPMPGRTHNSQPGQGSNDYHIVNPLWRQKSPDIQDPHPNLYHYHEGDNANIAAERSADPKSLKIAKQIKQAQLQSGDVVRQTLEWPTTDSGGNKAASSLTVDTQKAKPAAAATDATSQQVPRDKRKYFRASSTLLQALDWSEQAAAAGQRTQKDDNPLRLNGHDDGEAPDDHVFGSPSHRYNKHTEATAAFYDSQQAALANKYDASRVNIMSEHLGAPGLHKVC